MPMIKCPECGKEISDKAAACPNCGCPINYGKTYFDQRNTPIQPVMQPYIPEKPKHSAVGIVGFAFSIAQLIFGFPWCVVVCIISFILCSIGCFEKNKKHIFAIIGNAISFVLLLAYILVAYSLNG